MSMNINLRASINATLPTRDGKNKNKVLYEYFECQQTPTVVTKEIIRSNDPKKTYVDWYMSNFKNKSHIQKLNKFLKDHIDWDILWYEL